MPGGVPHPDYPTMSEAASQTGFDPRVISLVAANRPVGRQAAGDTATPPFAIGNGDITLRITSTSVVKRLPISLTMPVAAQ